MPVQIHRRQLLAGSLGLAVASGVLHTSASAVQPMSSPQANQGAVDWQQVAQALGAPGKLMDGDVFRISMPRTDLTVTAKGVTLRPAFALGSYAAFEQVNDTATVMGDLVLLDEEVNPVLVNLFANGFMISGLHNHLNELSPHVMYMHYMGMGDAVTLAQQLRQALSASATPLSDDVSSAPPAASPTTSLPVNDLSGTLGYEGMVAKGGVVQFTIPRAETITEDGMELLPAMGVATAINVQATDDGQAAVTGDFVMVASEVNPVAQALQAGGIDVTALHNHHLAEDPRLFYMHFLGIGAAADLATTLRSAIDQTNSKPS